MADHARALQAALNVATTNKVKPRVYGVKYGRCHQEGRPGHRHTPTPEGHVWEYFIQYKST
jgi:predicted phosphoadenosine phosphosulfate sulfurtransferase